MRILIFNWKDINHPRFGGAEYVTYQYAKNLVDFGHQVTWFTSTYPGAKSEELIDGIKILRRGNLWSMYIYAFFVYQKSRTDIDIVIDQIHGIPFFTPLYVRKPVLAWIHEIAGVIWFIEFPPAISYLGSIAEILYLKWYRKIPFITDALSTKNELITSGIPQNHIHTIPLTIDMVKPGNTQKSKIPSIIYVGRLTPMKRIELLIQAAAIIKTRFPHLKIMIAGSGKPAYEKKLKQLVRELKLDGVITFVGRVTDIHKWQLLRKAWLLVHPSIKEGFGLTVLEAAACGTPTVCFNVAGLRDLIKNGENGVIVSPQTPQALAKEIEELLANKQKLRRLSINARNWSKTFPSWKQQTKKLEKILLENA